MFLFPDVRMGLGLDPGATFWEFEVSGREEAGNEFSSGNNQACQAASFKRNKPG